MVFSAERDFLNYQIQFFAISHNPFRQVPNEKHLELFLCYFSKKVISEASCSNGLKPSSLSVFTAHLYSLLSSQA